MSEGDDCRGEYSFDCSEYDCGKSFTGDDLASIAKRGARHWNKEHGDQLSARYDTIDEVVYGGHHIQGNAYEVRKYKVYITAFDVMQRIGLVDGHLVPSDRDHTCPECHHHIPGPEDRIEENPDDPFCDEWMCRACVEEAKIERRSNENQSLGEFVTDGGTRNDCDVQPATDRSGGDLNAN